MSGRLGEDLRGGARRRRAAASAGPSARRRGRVSTASRTASSPSAACADDLDIRQQPEHRDQPVAHDRLVVGDQDADAVAHRGTLAVIWNASPSMPELARPPGLLDTGADAGQAAAAPGIREGAEAVGGHRRADDEDDCDRAPRRADGASDAGRVLARVAQSLLHCPAKRDGGRGREWAGHPGREVTSTEAPTARCRLDQFRDGRREIGGRLVQGLDRPSRPRPTRTPPDRARSRPDPAHRRRGRLRVRLRPHRTG